jgi:ferrochelatase
VKTVILVNVGTPDSPAPRDVGRYLNEFLMDEDIVSIPRPIRDILVKLVIVPRRRFTSSEKYKKIWTPQGSPLLFHSRSVEAKLQKRLGIEWRVLTAMQVGNPNLRDVLKANTSSGEVYLCPLYPQFAQATTGSALRIASQSHSKYEILDLKPFYEEDWFIDPVVQKIRKILRAEDHLLLSYHGLPVSQLKKKNAFCLASSDCCEKSQGCELNCYKAQCHRTSKAIREKLGLQSVTTSFQSRLGPVQWIGPSTEEAVVDLAQRGIRKIVVACPSFVADCLETLEEIALETKSLFVEKGGERFQYVGCVNDDELFIEGLASHLESSAKRTLMRS